ncbi:unnamed protein product [Rhodiola kirilowii]
MTARNAAVAEDLYHFNTNEITGAAIVSEVLIGRQNFVSWAKSMEIALSVRSKLEFVQGERPKPTDAALAVKWKRCNDVVMTWLLNSVSKKVVSHILHAKDATTAWRILHNRYAGSNVSRKFYLKKEVSNIRQGDLDIANYFEKLNAFWKELDSMSKRISCDEDSECANCRTTAREREEDRVIEFLMGLNDNYAHIRTHILALKELPTLDTVYDMALNAESQQKVTKHPCVEASALYSNHQENNYAKGQMRSGTGKPKGRLFCTHCEMSGHTKEFCYKLVGYPPGHKLHKSNMKNTSKGYDHAKSANMASCDSSSGGEKTESSNANQLPQFSNSQLHQLLALLKKTECHEQEGTNHMAGICLISKTLDSRSLDWVIDSGATDHFTYNLDLLDDVYKVSTACSVLLPNGETSRVKYAGKVALTKSLILHDVLYVPAFKFNLISISKLTGSSGCSVEFSKGCCVIQDHAHKINLGIGRLVKGLYWLKNADLSHTITCTATIKDVTTAVWHRRMGHLPINKLKKMFSNISTQSKDCDLHCPVCPMTKQTRLVFPSSVHKSIKPLELIHADVWGSYSTNTMSGCRFFLTIVDDFSRTTWTFLMKKKSEVSALVIKFFKLIETQYNDKIKTFRSDNGTEFFNDTLAQFFSDRGCIQQSSCPYTPQQNGVVERKHRHLLDVARALRFQANLPKVFWGDCVLSATYLINRSPSVVLNFKSPLEVLFGAPPVIHHLRVIGCLCYVGTIAHQRDKLDPRSTPCILLGYPYGQKGYKIYNLQTNEVLISRDVNFFKDIFPYKDINRENNTETDTENQVTVHVPFIPHNTDNDDYIPHDEEDVLTPVEEAVIAPVEDTILAPAVEANELPEPAILPVRRSNRLRQLPPWQTDYVCNTIQVRKSPHKLENFLSNMNCYTVHAAFTSALAHIKEPKTYNQAKGDPKWCEAMQTEISALERNNTWVITDLPENQSLIDCKWIFWIKLKSDGNIERYKARVVAKGFTQVEGIDYSETFAPVAKMTSVRCFLTVAAIKQWPIFQLDVDNAFLHGSLEEEVYMRLPTGFYDSQRKAGKVCRLTKSLYGLKQAPRQWFSKFTEAMLQFGFNQSLNDYSLFTLQSGDDFTMLLVYVDDVILTGTSMNIIQDIKAFIHDKFKIKDLGTLKYFLGLEVARNSTGIFLHQRKYATDLLTEYDMVECKPAKTPLPAKHKLSLSTAELLPDPMIYRKMVGKLIYLTITRPDLSHAVHILSQFMNEPNSDHLKAANRLLRYIKGAPAQGIFFSATSQLQMSAFCDADWAACPKTRRSVTGFCILIGESLVSWRTKKQAIVSRSSAESEYRAMAAVCTEVVWLLILFTEMHASISTPISLYCDNQAALHIAKNPVFHERTKHIELDCHFVRHYINNLTILPVYIQTLEQPADLFTKQLSHDHLQHLLCKLGVSNFLHSPA